MKSNPVFLELVPPLLLVTLLLLFLNPFDWWMPSVLVAVLLCVFLLIFSIFALFFLKERAEDERDNVHRMFSGRMGFFSGALVLVVGVIVQEWQGRLDPWLVYTLIAMILGKIFGREYSKRKW